MGSCIAPNEHGQPETISCGEGQEMDYIEYIRDRGDETSENNDDGD